MTDCEMNMHDCDGLKGVLEKMFDDPHCDLILNKAHGGQAETDAGRKLYEIVPEGCIVVEVGTPGYSNLADSIPWVMEVFRFLHLNNNLCPTDWDTSWPAQYPHIWKIFKEWDTPKETAAAEAAAEAEAAAAAAAEADAEADAVARMAATAARGKADAASTAALAEGGREGNGHLLYKFKQIIQLVLTNTRFYNAGCEIYNMSFAGSEDGKTPDLDAYIYNLQAAEKKADWRRNENSQFKRIGFTRAFTREVLFKWWKNTKMGTEFCGACFGRESVTFGERWRWFGPRGARRGATPWAGGLVSCPLDESGKSNVIYLEPTPLYVYRSPADKSKEIISKNSLNPFEDYQSIFQQIPTWQVCTVIFTISCKPHRDGYEKLKGWDGQTFMNPGDHTLTRELFRLWIDLLVHNDHVFRNGKRCLKLCPDVVPLSSRMIHEHDSGISEPVDIVTASMDTPANNLVNNLMARETADLDPGAIDHLFVTAREEAKDDLDQIMEKYYEVPGQDEKKQGKVILKDRFKDVLKVLNCFGIYPCGADYKGSLSNMIRNIKKHLHGCLCMVCECGDGNPECGKDCPTATSPGGGGGKIARGRIAYKRKSKRRKYKRLKSRRSRKRPNKKRKSKRNKRTRRRTKRKTGRKTGRNNNK